MQLAFAKQSTTVRCCAARSVPDRLARMVRQCHVASCRVMSRHVAWPPVRRRREILPVCGADRRDDMPHAGGIVADWRTVICPDDQIRPVVVRRDSGRDSPLSDRYYAGSTPQNGPRRGERSFAECDRRHRLEYVRLRCRRSRKVITWINTPTTTRVTSWNTASQRSRGLPGGSTRRPSMDRIDGRMNPQRSRRC